MLIPTDGPIKLFRIPIKCSTTGATQNMVCAILIVE